MRLASLLFAFCMGTMLAVPALASDTPPANAPGPVVGSPPVGMNFGVGGGTIPKGTWVFMINYRFADNDTWFRNGGAHTPSNPFGGSDQKSTQHMFAFKGRYGLGYGMDIRALIPVGHIKFNEKRLGPDSSTHGCGDANILLHKAFLRQEEGAPITFGAEVGILFPTGSTSRDGLGTGSWGAIVGVGATYVFDGGRQLAELEGFYFYRGKGGNKSIKNYTYRDWGDYIWINARYVYALTDWLDVGLESQFSHNFQDKDTKQQGTGAKISNMNNAYTTWFVGPTATLKLPRWNSTFGVGVGISVYQHYEAQTSGAALGVGDPNKKYATGSSLGSKWRIEATYSFTF